MSIQSRIEEVYGKESRLFNSGLAIITLLWLGAWIWLWTPLAFVVATLVAAILSLALDAVVIKYGEKLTDLAYYQQLEHIVEHSLSENDSGVYLRAQEHRQKLKDSGNPYKVRVYEIIFREGVWADENWEEYQERLKAERHQIITQRHQELQARNRKDYLAALAGQKIK
jgi:uncharacterized membrane protein YhiD involved in acid resistance